MAEPALAARSPLATFSFPSTPGGKVIAVDCATSGIARMVLRRGCLRELVRSVHESFGVELPRGPWHIGTDDLAFVAVGADAWLAVAGKQPDLAESLDRAVGEFAAVSAQGGGCALLRLSGPRIREALAKMLPIDLHPRSFAIGAAASTVAAHIALTLWRREDAPDGAAVFETVVPRSLAVNFAQVLAHSAAEFGFNFSA